jgi:hypothetical protein
MNNSVYTTKCSLENRPKKTDGKENLVVQPPVENPTPKNIIVNPFFMSAVSPHYLYSSGV